MDYIRLLLIMINNISKFIIIISPYSQMISRNPPPPRPNPLIFHILHHVEPLSNFSPHSPPLFQSHPLRLAVHQVDLRDRCVRGYEIAIHPRISSGIKWPRIGLRLFHGWPVVAASLARPPLAKGS